MSLYADPIDVRSLEECHFYHLIDLPGYGSSRANGICAAASSGTSAASSSRGSGHSSSARPTASWASDGAAGRRGGRYDLSPEHSIDVVPYARSDHEALRRELQEHVARLNRVLARHRAFGSDARLAHGTVYDIPGGLGEFDVTTLGSILLHLRDPFRALESAAARTRGTIVVTDRGAPRALRTPSVC